MNNICRDIFRAIQEGKWLKIEYKNREDYEVLDRDPWFKSGKAHPVCRWSSFEQIYYELKVPIAR